MILETGRNLLVRTLAFYFRRVETPSFRGFTEHPDQYLVVLKSHSIVHEALLKAFATRSKLSVAHISTPEASAKPTSTIAWCAADDVQLVTQVNSSNRGKLVTFNVFIGCGPVRNNQGLKISYSHSLGAIIGRNLLIVVFGAALDRGVFKDTSLKRSQRLLKVDFYENLRIVRGTPFQPIDVQARMVTGGAEFDALMSTMAAGAGVPAWKLKMRARKAFYTLAANPLRPMYFILGIICAFIIKRLFTTVTTSGLDRLREVIRTHPVVLVPTHRSHLDYVILSQRLYESHINPPLIAAGVNLSFWPFGFLFRSVGAYFLNRDARADRLHTVVLKRYVTYLAKRGHTQEFFIEGGRSRSGKMRPPRLGLLRVFVDAYREGIRRDILFVPVSIAYESVIEDKVFGDENTGQKKEKESLLALFKARKVFAKKYGEVQISFGEPYSLREALGGSGNDTSEKEVRVATQKLADELTIQIRDQGSVSLSGLAYTALMTAPKYGLTRAALTDTVRGLAGLISIRRGFKPKLGVFTETLDAFLAGHKQKLDDLCKGGVVNLGYAAGQEIFYIPGNRRFTGDFYRNATLNNFVTASIYHLLKLVGSDTSPESARPFFDMLESDLMLGSWADFAGEYSAVRSHFETNGTPAALVPVLPAILQSNIQALLWVYRSVLGAGQPIPVDAIGDEFGDAVVMADESKVKNSLQNGFKVAKYLGLLDRTEASSQSNITAALESLVQRGRLSSHRSKKFGGQLILKKGFEGELALLERANTELSLWLSRNFKPLGILPHEESTSLDA